MKQLARIHISSQLEMRIFEAPKRDDDPYTLKGEVYRRDKDGQWEFFLTRFFVDQRHAHDFIKSTFIINEE